MTSRAVKDSAKGQDQTDAGVLSRRSVGEVALPQIMQLATQGSGVNGNAVLRALQQSHGNRYVQRALAIARAVRPEVDGDLESAIEAGRTGGHSLETGVTRQMESVMGSRLDSVRIHTDPHADMLSRALNARAFTTGQDIFFRQGEYQPGTPGGKELLAHELTHVVQQNPLQSGTGAREPGMSQPVQRTGGGTQRLQRFESDFPVAGMGSSSGNSRVSIKSLYGQIATETESGPDKYGPTFLPFAGQVDSTTLLENVVSGMATLRFFESAEINNMVLNDIQYASWQGQVPFTVVGEQVLFSAPLIQSDAHGSGAVLAVNVGSGVTPGGGYATFTVTVGTNVSQTTGGSIGIGPISGSIPVSGNTTYSGGISRTFTINLRTTPPKPIAAPDVSFKVGKDELTDGQEAILSKWYDGLGSGKDLIQNGKRAVTITGYASTTGKRKKNRDLSERRARVVERILRGHVGSSATLNIFYVGEDDSKTPDETEDPQWRRATIVVQPPNRMAPGLPGPAAPGSK